jgi:YHS domain-containing protein
MTLPETVIDPVCGMTIGRNQAPFTREHSSSVYYLCSIECTRKFEADADAYAAVAGLQLPGWGMTPHPENVVKQFRTDTESSG